MKLITYRCSICGITESEYDALANTFRGGRPPTCDGPTSFLSDLDGIKRVSHEMTEMEIVPG